MACLYVFSVITEEQHPCPLPEKEEDRNWKTLFGWEMRHNHVFFQLFLANDEDYKDQFRLFERLFVMFMVFCEALCAAGATQIFLIMVWQPDTASESGQGTNDAPPPDWLQLLFGYLCGQMFRYIAGSYLAEQIYRSDADKLAKLSKGVWRAQMISYFVTLAYVVAGIVILSWYALTFGLAHSCFSKLDHFASVQFHLSHISLAPCPCLLPHSPSLSVLQGVNVNVHKDADILSQTPRLSPGRPCFV